MPRTLGLSRQALDRLQKITARIEAASYERRRDCGLPGYGKVGYAELVRIAVDRFLEDTGNDLPHPRLPVGSRGEPAKLTAARERYAETTAKRKRPASRKRGAR